MRSLPPNGWEDLPTKKDVANSENAVRQEVVNSENRLRADFTTALADFVDSACHRANTPGAVEGSPIALSPAHVKVRREGYGHAR